MKLTWYGTAGLILREDETCIAFDPFLGLPVYPGRRPLPGVREFRQVPDIFATHGHLDHIYHIPALYRNTPVTVHCTRTPRETLLKHGFSEEKILEIAPGWEGVFGPFRITAWQGRHCVFDLPLLRRTILARRFWQHPLHLLRVLSIHLTWRENKETLFYEVECKGARIQIMGSMNLDPHVQYPTGADILILPLQGRSDQDIYALEIVERLRPRSILLDHYDNTFPPLSGRVDPAAFIQNVWLRFRIPCKPLKKYISVEIHPSERRSTL